MDHPCKVTMLEGPVVVEVSVVEQFVINNLGGARNLLTFLMIE